MSVTNKDKYRLLCDEKPIPLFMQAWWMDAVCMNKEWDVCLSEREGKIVGVLPYLCVKKFFYRCVIQPHLTQFNGVNLFFPKDADFKKRLVFEKEVTSDLIEQIEKRNIHYFNQNFHYSVQNREVFVSKRFKEKIRHTYVIEDISKTKKVFDSFSYAKKKHINKSFDKLDIKYNLSSDVFYDFHATALKKKGEKIVYSKELFEKIYYASIEREQGQLIAVYDKQNNLHAALFVIWDKQSAYYLISAINHDYKSSGASTLMVWEAIKFLSDKTKVFDFEGSMIPNVAKSFKEFGGVKKSYANISKSFSWSFSFLMKLRGM